MIRSVVVSPFQVNCWLLACPKSGDVAVIDPGDDVPEILKLLAAMSGDLGKPLRVRYLLHTHAHLDHFGGTKDLYEKLGAADGKQIASSKPVIALHSSDEPFWNELCSQGKMFGIEYEPPLPPTQLLKDGEELRVGALRLTVLHTPGHSPGGLSFYLQPDPALPISGTLFSGDTLFQGSIGRTDLWGGDHKTLLNSIRERLWRLPDATRVCCGHGPDTRIGIEKRDNPFIR